MGIFDRKKSFEDLRNRTVVIDRPANSEMPSNALVDLCADIIAHPADYELRLEHFGLSLKAFLRHKKHGKAVFLSRVDGLGKVFYCSPLGLVSARSERTLVDQAFEAHDAFAASCQQAKLTEQLAQIRAERCRVPLIPDQVRSAIAVCRIGDQPAARIVANIAERMLPVLEGTHRIVPAVPVSVETRTAGDDRPVYPDFLTRGAARPLHWWEDRDGKRHGTRAAMRAANIEIRHRRQADGL